MTKHYDILKKGNWYQPDLAKPTAPLPTYKVILMQSKIMNLLTFLNCLSCRIFIEKALKHG